MQSAEHNERIVSDKKLSSFVKSKLLKFFIVKILKLSSISSCVLRCGVRSTTSVSLVIENIN